MSLQQEIKKIKKTEGRVRGAVFKTDLNYIKDVKGKEGVEKVKKKLKKVEPDFDPDKAKNMKWYPLNWRVMVLLVIKESFGWARKDLYEMGRIAPSNSFIARTILRYFYDFEKTCHEAPSYWGKHYDRGELELVEFNDKDKKVVYRLRDFDLHPVMCPYLTGYFQGIAELTKREAEIETEETKCSFKEGDYHEFVIRWS